MAKQRTIAVVTGSRAEFGLLYWVMYRIKEHRRLRLVTIVTGTHLTTGTWQEIAGLGFKIDAKVPMQRRDLTGRAADVQALARGIAGLGRAFEKLKPDVVLMLGDRIEALAAASAASIGGIRVAHIHGGDRAEGVADEAMRHAISKLSHLHLAATRQSRERLIRMGEDRRFVWNMGSPAMDDVAMLRRSRRPVNPMVPFIVVQHPIGDEDRIERHRMEQTLRAVRLACARHGFDGLPWVLAPNSDPGSAGIRAAIEAHLIRVTREGGQGRGFIFHRHVPRLQLIRHLYPARAIVGNSSAGLIEAAALRVPCVNIGPRQGGRERPNNVIDCDYGEKNVRVAIEKALRMNRLKIRHPYGDGRADDRIAKLLATIDLDAVPLRKRNMY